MNFSNLSNWGTLIFFFVHYFIFSFNAVEADRIRIIHRKLKTPNKLYFTKSVPSIYAKKYSYGNPITSFSTQGKFGKNKFSSRRSGKGPRNYANGFRNWSSDNIFNKVINKPRIDNLNRNHQKKRKEPLVFMREVSFNNKQKQKNRPQRGNPLQRPLPPKQVSDFDEDYYFPEEAVRTETKFDYESGFQRSKKRRRNPSESEKVIKGQDSKFFTFSEKPYYLFKQKNRDTPFSYSTFVQHPNTSNEDFEEEEKQQYIQPVVKNKKKKVKKKSNFRKKNKEEEYYSSEKDDEPEGYQSITFKDYEISGKRTKKPNKKPFRDEDDYNSVKSSYSKPQNVEYMPHNVGFVAFEDNYNIYKENLRPQNTLNFNPSFSQPWHTYVETTARPLIQQPQIGLPFTQYNSNQYFQNNYQIPKSQQIQSFPGNEQGSYHSESDNSYAIIPTLNPQPPYNYNYKQIKDQILSINQNSNTFHKNIYSNPSSPTFQPSSNFHQNSVTIEKSVPIYENTYYNYNPLAQTHIEKNQDENKVYKHSINSHLSPSYASQTPSLPPQRINDENDFIKKHQSLYNKELSGMPLQGDGYGPNSSKKDYDIGYGDFQFDENPFS